MYDGNCDSTHMQETKLIQRLVYLCPADCFFLVSLFFSYILLNKKVSVLILHCLICCFDIYVHYNKLVYLHFSDDWKETF